uniref:Uncharacterized protein n=1 Tax=Gadus morhua TaxID=8049 RepID=A0A8C5AZZ0_GADMO
MLPVVFSLLHTVCYVLDAILIAYSIVLTVLYIRAAPRAAVLTRPLCLRQGLTPHISDTYETIRVEKKAQM